MTGDSKVNKLKMPHPIKVKIVSTFKPDGNLGFAFSSYGSTSGIVSCVMIVEFFYKIENVNCNSKPNLTQFKIQTLEKKCVAIFFSSASGNPGNKQF